MKMKIEFNLIGFVIHIAFFLVVVIAEKKSSKEDKSVDYGITSSLNDESVHNYFDSEANIDPFENEKMRRPIVVNTWNYTAANIKAWESLTSGKSAVDAVVDGISVCEFDPEKCDRQVGFGDNPDENGETTLDAMIMDGNNMDTGGVGGIRRIKNAIGVAKYVLRNTKHSLIVGEFATDFAIKLGFQEESLSSNISIAEIKKWKFKDHCQPNHWVDVKPDPKTSCGPYTPNPTEGSYNEKTSALSSRNFHKIPKHMRRNYKWQDSQHMFNKYSKPNRRRKNSLKNRNKFNSDYGHDTITMIAVNKKGEIAAGSSTNGLKYKIPGRVGDSPIAGSGVYADAQVGAAIGTGDGDIMQRFVPSFFAVEEMRRGAGPSQAVHSAVRRISKFYPDFWGAVVAVNKNGTFAAACSGMEKFPFSVTNYMLKETRVFWISCIHGDE